MASSDVDSQDTCINLSLIMLTTTPGWSIKSYKDNDPIPLYVNKVYSDNTQLQYAYYDLPFVCSSLPVRRSKAFG